MRDQCRHQRWSVRVCIEASWRRLVQVVAHETIYFEDVGAVRCPLYRFDQLQVGSVACLGLGSEHTL